MSPDRRTLLALFALAFGLRVLCAVVLGGDSEINPSPYSYSYRLADGLHDNLDWVSQPSSPIAPGYVTALVIVFRVIGVSWWAAILLNAFLAGASAIVIYRIGEKRLGRNIGLFSALWLALSVPNMLYSIFVFRDVMTTFCVLWVCYVISGRFSEMAGAIWAAALYTLLIYVEPMFLVFLPVIVVFFALAATKHRLLNIQYVFLFVAAVFVLNVPWTIRNYAVYGEFVPISLEATVYTRPVAGLFTRDDNGETKQARDARETETHRPSFNDNMREFWRVVRLSDTEPDFATGTSAEPAWSVRHNAINFGAFGLLLPFFLLGVARAVVRRDRVPLILISVVAIYTLLRGFIGASEHSRLLVEPLIILIAFYGLVKLWEKLRRTSLRNAGNA